MTAKEARVTVRMSQDLHAWVEHEAGAREMDAAAFVRMCLAERRNGARPGSLGLGESVANGGAGAPAVAPAPIVREVLNVASALLEPVAGIDPEPVGDDEALQQFEPAAQEPGGIDLDDMLDGAFELADASGLTAPREEDQRLPPGSVRVLHRTPPRFSPASAGNHLRDLMPT